MVNKRKRAQVAEEPEEQDSFDQYESSDEYYNSGSDNSGSEADQDDDEKEEPEEHDEPQVEDKIIKIIIKTFYFQLRLSSLFYKIQSKIVKFFCVKNSKNIVLGARFQR